MKILILIFERRIIKLSCSPSYTVHQLALRIKQSCGIQENSTGIFYFKGHRLEPEETLEYYGIVSSSHLDYTV